MKMTTWIKATQTLLIIALLSQLCVLGCGLFIEVTETNAKFDIEKLTPADRLAVGAMQGKLELVENALNQGVDVNTRFEGDYWGHRNFTALLFAAYYGRVAVTRYLLSHGADITARSQQWNRTPLMVAAESYGGRPNTVRALLEHGADVHATDSYGETALLITRNPYIAKLLLEYGADVNVKDRKGRTPLLIATADERKDMVNVLLEYGADLTIRPENGWTALELAEAKGYHDISELLLNAGSPRPEKTYIATQHLINAIEAHDIEGIHQALRQGANINAHDPSADSWVTVLTTALRQGNPDIIRLLIEYGVDVNARIERLGETPLIFALSGCCVNVKPDVITLLLDAGADVNGTTSGKSGGWTALMSAVGIDNIEIVKLLIERGANVNAKDWQGHSAMTIARYKAKHKDTSPVTATRYIGEPEEDSGEESAMIRLLKEAGAQ